MPDLRLFLPKRLPMPLITVAIISVCLTWLPLTAIAKYKLVPHEKPRIHLFQDMDNQPKLKAQAASPIFNDGRAARQPVTGTVARGHLSLDENLTAGYTVARTDDPDAPFAPQWLTGFPDGLDIDEDFLVRGKLKFNTFCYPCHGKSGFGNGPVNVASLRVAQGDAALSYGTQWTPSANLHQREADGRLTFGAELYPNGELYNTITVGKNTMAGYGHAIPVDDRWSIVAYVRALQLSQNAEAAQQAMDAATEMITPETQTADSSAQRNAE
jgi:mono/diheme cytochrome c family protein